MNCLKTTNLRRADRLCAMSLIEMIGVLAVIAVLAGALIPAAIRILDRLASEKEVAALSSLGDSFQNGILRTRQITAVTNWDSFIAKEVGLNVASVTENPRRMQRAVLYDKGGWLDSGLPYSQTNTTPPGLSSPPSNARIMIVSSLGAPLPANLNNTVMDGPQFAELWDTAEFTLPSGTPWNGWAGRADDVKIHRVNLAPQFVKLVLSTYTGTNGLYKIENSGFYIAPKSNAFSGYFLKGTVLQLYAAAPTLALQQTEVLDRDISFVFENGVWRNSILGGVATGMGDISGIVEAFLRAPENINAANTNMAPSGQYKLQQTIIVTNFIAYMSNYNRWEDLNFTNNAEGNALKTHLLALQPVMMDAVEGIYKNAPGHYPTNNFEPCVPTLSP